MFVCLLDQAPKIEWRCRREYLEIPSSLHNPGSKEGRGDPSLIAGSGPVQCCGFMPLQGRVHVYHSHSVAYVAAELVISYFMTAVHGSMAFIVKQVVSEVQKQKSFVG